MDGAVMGCCVVVDEVMGCYLWLGTDLPTQRVQPIYTKCNQSPTQSVLTDLQYLLTNVYLQYLFLSKKLELRAVSLAIPAVPLNLKTLDSLTAASLLDKRCFARPNPVRDEPSVSRPHLWTR